jgi:hypothetical protein
VGESGIFSLLGGVAALTGYVSEMDSKGRAAGPLAGATVEVDGAAVAATDYDGRFQVSPIGSGVRLLAVSKLGYVPVSRSVTIVGGHGYESVAGRDDTSGVGGLGGAE